MVSKSSRQLSDELERMKAEVEGVVDKNYEKYNNEFIDKVAEHNLALKRENEERSQKELHSVAEEGSRYLHNQAKGRTIII